ncbi:MAG: hypothetical protein E7371_05425 [Clostridiales bacterium]|nr:hypothetical protein [Clostridiales bacterium]
MKVFKKAGVALLGAALGCCMFASCISTKLTVTYMVGDETYRVQEYDMDTTISLPTPPTKEGHTFIGWYTDEACTVPYAEGSVTAGFKLYAKFAASKMYVVVNTAGGTKIDPIEVVQGQEYTIPAAEKEGYTFIGYTYVDENGEEQEFPLTGTYPSNAGIRITANYEINKYKVTFVGAEEKQQEVAYGSVAVAEAMNKAGYTLEGWYTDEACTTKFDFATAITADITLYANYTPKTFTITVNGAEVGYANPQVVFGETYTLATPNRGSNYEFVKFTMNGQDFPATGTYTWTEDIAVDVVWEGAGRDIMFFDGANELTSLRIETEYEADITDLRLPAVPAKTGYETDGKWYVDANCTEEFVATGTISNDIRLYAKYTACEYTVTFTVWDAASKTMKNVPVTVTYGETIQGVPARAEREFYRFEGYFYNDATFDLTQAYTYTYNITVEEKWVVDENIPLFEYDATGNFFKEREPNATEWTYVYFVGETYTFADTVSLSMVTVGGDMYATVSGNSLKANAVGTFVVKVNNNGNVYNRTIKTVEYVQSFTLTGTQYDNAWGVTADGTAYKRDSLGIWDKKVAVDAGEAMKVGKSKFIPEINVNNKVSAMDMNNVNLTLTADGTVVESSNDTYWVADGAVYFNDSLVGKKVVLTAVPKYAVNATHKAVYNLEINNAVNVYTNEELKAAFANTSVTEVNILRDIKAELSADQKQTFTVNGQTIEAPWNGRDKDGNDEIGTGVYTRLSGNLKVNGNYFTVDGSKIPLVDGRDGKGHNVYAYALQNVQFSIFNFGARHTTSYDLYQMENLNVVGNGDMDATAKSGYLIDGKEVLTYSGACIGIQVGSGTLSMDGVTSRFGAFAANAYAHEPILKQDGTGYTHAVQMIAKDCKFESSWANNIYVYGFASITLDSCYIGVANGAAIHFDSKAPNIANGKDINVDCELNLLGDTDIQNWVVGSEAWFTAYSATSAVAAIKTGLEDAVQQVSQMVGVSRTVINPDGKVNFAVLMKTTGDTSDWVNDNVGHGTLNLNITTFDTVKLSQGDTAQAMNIGSKYAKFANDASALGFGYIEGLVEIINK